MKSVLCGFGGGVMNWRKGLGTVTQEFLVLYLPNVYPRVPGHPPCRDATSRNHCFPEISPHVFFIFSSFREVKDCFSSYLRATTACSCGREGASNEGSLVLAWSLPSQDVPDAGNREQFPLSLDVRGCFVISFVDKESVSLIRLLLYGFCQWYRNGIFIFQNAFGGSAVPQTPTCLRPVPIERVYNIRKATTRES